MPAFKIKKIASNLTLSKLACNYLLSIFEPNHHWENIVRHFYFLFLFFFFFYIFTKVCEREGETRRGWGGILIFPSRSKTSCSVLPLLPSQIQCDRPVITGELFLDSVKMLIQRFKKNILNKYIKNICV